MPFSQPITFSDGGPDLDRAAHLRERAPALTEDPSALCLPLAAGRLLVDERGAAPALAWQGFTPEFRAMMDGAPVFLGMMGDAPRFAARLAPHEAETPDPRWPAGVAFAELRAVAGRLAPGDASAAATARGILGWHETHRFCARCGAESRSDEGGWRRRCTACRALHFPRTDPVVIMLVIDHDDRVLLGRQSAWPEGLYSCLAGFMEPGETIEDAVRREVMEETAIAVGRVRYLACQPWPFPSSLMLGCVGEALSREITIDPTELEDALWLGRAEAADVLAGRHPRIGAPRIDAIARALMTAWVAGEIEPF